MERVPLGTPYTEIVERVARVVLTEGSELGSDDGETAAALEHGPRLVKEFEGVSGPAEEGCLRHVAGVVVGLVGVDTSFEYGTLEGREGAMATQNNVHVSDGLLAVLQAKAETEGKTVDELAEEALRKGLEDRDWQDLLAYGRKTGRESGYAAADVPEIVKKRRRINAVQRS